MFYLIFFTLNSELFWIVTFLSELWVYLKTLNLICKGINSNLQVYMSQFLLSHNLDLLVLSLYFAIIPSQNSSHNYDLFLFLFPNTEYLANLALNIYLFFIYLFILFWIYIGQFSLFSQTFFFLELWVYILQFWLFYPLVVVTLFIPLGKFCFSVLFPYAVSHKRQNNII